MPACHSCGVSNAAGQAFCGSCGSALDLKTFIAAQVKSEVAASIKDRDAMELESAARVFERAFGWLKLIGGAAAIVIVVGSVFGIWKATDFLTGVKEAKQAVVDTASQTKGDMKHASELAIAGIRDAASNATQANNDSAQKAQELSVQLGTTAKSARSEIESEGASVRKDTRDAQGALQEAQHLKPQVQEMLQQLNQATAAVRQQQETLSSTENFAKQIFSSHLTELFKFPAPNAPTVAVFPATGPGKTSTGVWILLSKTPIDNTLQMQFGLSAQPPYSYFKIAHNLILFLWGDPIERLYQPDQMLSVSYFPDSSDKEQIHKLTVHDGRVWADDQPLPKMNGIDLNWKGNKWMPIFDGTSQPAAPQPSH